MSNLLFPDLPGLTFDLKAVPTWSTVVQKSKNRARTALLNDPYPLWKFELNFEFLRGAGFNPAPAQRSARNPGGYSELDQILGFYNYHHGSCDDFLLDPCMLTRKPGENQVHGSQIGIGDGTTTIFYLTRECGLFVDEVQNPGKVSISVNGVVSPSSAWTLGAWGAVTFVAAPALGAVITWDGTWRYRVCFAEDSLGLGGFMYQLYELRSLKLEEVKL